MLNRFSDFMIHQSFTMSTIKSGIGTHIKRQGLSIGNYDVVFLDKGNIKGNGEGRNNDSNLFQ